MIEYISHVLATVVYVDIFLMTYFNAIRLTKFLQYREEREEHEKKKKKIRFNYVKEKC